MQLIAEQKMELPYYEYSRIECIEMAVWCYYMLKKNGANPIYLDRYM